MITEYREIITTAIDAFNEFMKAGYSETDTVNLLTPVPVDQWKKVAKRILHPEKAPAPSYRSKEEVQQIEAIRRTLEEHAGIRISGSGSETQTDKLLRKLQIAANAKRR